MIAAESDAEQVLEKMENSPHAEAGKTIKESLTQEETRLSFPILFPFGIIVHEQ